MRQLTIELTNKEYQRLEYYLGRRYEKPGKMEMMAKVALLEVIVAGAQEELDEAMAELEKEDGQPNKIDDEVAMQQAIDGLRAAYDEAGKMKP